MVINGISMAISLPSIHHRLDNTDQNSILNDVNGDFISKQHLFFIDL